MNHPELTLLAAVCPFLHMLALVLALALFPWSSRLAQIPGSGPTLSL